MLKRWLNSILLLLTLSLLSGCSWLNSSLGGNTTKDAKAEVEWPFAKEAVLVDLVADIDLNFYSNQPHTLVLGVVQVADAKVFVDWLAKPEAVIKTLVSGKAATEVLKFERYVVSPGKKTTLKIDRVQEAKFVGFVAGYYQFNALQASRLFKIPLNIQTSGIVTTTYKAEPAVLALRLFLGSDRIVNAETLTYDFEKKIVVETVPLDSSKPEVSLTDGRVSEAKASSEAAMKLTD
jgi:predicted component of type VI protein secretion system